MSKKAAGDYVIEEFDDGVARVDAPGGGWRVIRFPGKIRIESPFETMVAEYPDEVVLAIVALRMNEKTDGWSCAAGVAGVCSVAKSIECIHGCTHFRDANGDVIEDQKRLDELDKKLNELTKPPKSKVEKLCSVLGVTFDNDEEDD